MKNCDNCGKETTNPRFCSKSCAAIKTNKEYPKRKPEGNCAGCSQSIKSSRKYCKLCFPIYYCKDITLDEAIYSKHYRSNAYSLIRNRARNLMLREGHNSCSQCGYNKHVEIGHKKPISSFEGNTLLSVINHKDNLLVLCPNCHWEYDNLNK